MPPRARDLDTPAQAALEGDTARDACVLILPGMTMNETLFPDLGRLTMSVGFNDLVVGPDGSTPDLVTHRMGFYVRLLEAKLAARLASQPAPRLVVGHSFGGMLALAWLLDGGATSADIGGLVLVGTTAGPMFDVVKLRIGIAALGELRLPLKPLIRFWNRPAVTRGVKRLLGGVSTPQPVDFRSLTRRSDFALDMAGWRNTDWRAMRSYRLAMDGFDVRSRLGEIRTPTIVLHGDRDSLIPPDAGRALADGLPNAQFRLVRGAAHGLPLTHPMAVLDAVDELSKG